MTPTFDAPESIPEAQRATATFPLRYEDLSQDGRLILDCAAHALGEAVWAPLLSRDPVARAALSAGLIPILSRLAIAADPGPFAVELPLSASGAFELAHATGETGEVERIFLNMWVEITGQVAITRMPRSREGKRARAGRIYAEHVFTRLFAAPGERKVTRLDLPGTEPVPPKRVPLVPPSAVATLPEGAEALDAAPSPDDARIVIGLRHTDANQHVNSLAYLQLFEESALRRFAALGKSASVLAREVDVAYRKPLFAGQTARVVLRAFTHEGRLGAVGHFIEERAMGSPGAKPNAFVRMMFE